MKVLYSQIKQLIPGFQKSPKEIGEIFTFLGFMVDGFQKVQYQKKEDYLISLEIRQNRPDCLSVWGLARELGAYCEKKVNIPQKNIALNLQKNPSKLKIKVSQTVKPAIRCILATKIENVQKTSSPLWLKNYLTLMGINSINLLVDLSNYIMFLTGYPSHLLDYQKMQGDLIWDFNQTFDTIKTLDGSVVKLCPQNNKKTLIIRDKKQILGLAGLIGGRNASISTKTSSVIVEMALYDSRVINQNSRDLKISTEAGLRLGKFLQPASIEVAFSLLLNLIVQYSGGKLSSDIFHFLSKKKKKQKLIVLNLKKINIFSGIKIPTLKVLKILKNLNFIIQKKTKTQIYLFSPLFRSDIKEEEDVIEEILRIFDFRNIPKNETPKQQVVKNITPLHLKIEDVLKNFFTMNGFNETLTLPMVELGLNNLSFLYKTLPIKTENSINKDLPELRSSLFSGMFKQAENYLKKGISEIKLFEIGKIFYQKNKTFKEHTSLGLLLYNEQATGSELNQIQQVGQRALNFIGLQDLIYKSNPLQTSFINPLNLFDIYYKNIKIGILFKLKLNKFKHGASFIEINLKQVFSILEKTQYKNNVFELTQKLISLDLNLEISLKDNYGLKLQLIKQKIPEKFLWNIEIIDVFITKEKTQKITLRITYCNLQDNQAKKIHLTLLKNYSLLMGEIK